jgi:hypothetical protein
MKVHESYVCSVNPIAKNCKECCQFKLVGMFPGLSSKEEIGRDTWRAYEHLGVFQFSGHTKDGPFILCRAKYSQIIPFLHFMKSILGLKLEHFTC